MPKPFSKTAKAWPALKKNRDDLAKQSLPDLFEADPARFTKFSLSCDDITVDFSKQRIDHNTISLLKNLSEERHLSTKIEELFQGEILNVTENRAAMHVALRDRTDRQYFVDQTNITSDIKTTLNRILAFSDSIRDGSIAGSSGDKFNRVIIIGVGGSVTGTEFIYTALKSQRTSEIEFDFIASLDSSALKDALVTAKPKNTLFLVVSKTFSTEDTLTNAINAKQRIKDHLGNKAIQYHFTAITENQSAASEFGINHKLIFPLWNWVGGRYSTCSAVGLPIALANGSAAFMEFLDGAHSMDRHFEVTPPEKNLAIMLALIDLWNRSFWNISALAILPYDYRMRLFPGFVQALIMESNGKSAKLSGRKNQQETAPIVFGKLGSEAQHTFMQLLHQAPMTVSSEFIIALTDKDDTGRDRLMSNMIAQSRALMCGISHSELEHNNQSDIIPHKVCPGNKPSTTIMLNSINPATLGSLVSLYEHRAFVEGVLWKLNPFDQWGVELGKNIASDLLSHISNGSLPTNRDSSTVGLINRYQDKKAENSS